MKKTLILVAGFMLVTLIACVNAQEVKKDRSTDKKEPVVNSATKQVQGEVSNIGKRFISLVYERNADTGSESEILFPIDAKTKIEHKRSISEISQGDTVLIIYSEETSDFGDRQQTRNKAEVVRFIKPADAQSVYKPKAAATEDTQVIEGLSLKGVK